MSIFRPKWKSLNPDRRNEWIEKANLKSMKNVQILFKLAQFDVERHIRLAALNMIVDELYLEKIASLNTMYVVRQAAYKKLKNENSKVALLDIIKHDDNLMNKKNAIKKLKDKKALQYIIDNENLYPLRYIAYCSLGIENSTSAILDTLKNENNKTKRRNAINRLSDKKILEEYAVSDKDYLIRMTAYTHLNKKDSVEALEDCAKNDPIYANRILAYEKLGKEDSPEALKDISINDNLYENRMLAYKKMRKKTSNEALFDIALNDCDPKLRKKAAKKLITIVDRVNLVIFSNDIEIKKMVISNLSNSKSMSEPLSFSVSNSTSINYSELSEYLIKELLITILSSTKESERKKLIKKFISFYSSEITAELAYSLGIISSVGLMQALERTNMTLDKLLEQCIQTEKYWQCQKCNSILIKGSTQDTMSSIYKMVGRNISNGYCSNCGTQYSQEEIYDGKWDVEIIKSDTKQTIKRIGYGF